ncbi:MAG: hypothetical protein KGI51_06910 [Rhodospirillales bacterium]|nr:hypothetical protein [Rhodospirillales bacterium]
MSGSGETRALARALADAPETRIAKAVALVDGMAIRGAADTLIAPLRGRLAGLGIGRRVNFGRLLFLPLDPVIVPAQSWRPGMAAIPRGALPPIIAATEAALGEEARAIAASLQTEVDPAPRLGPLLWRQAAAPIRALEAAAPPGWAESGLPPASLGPIARGIAAVLTAWPALCPLAGGDAQSRDLAEALGEAAGEGPDVWALVLAVALARGADPVPIARLGTELAGRGGPAMHQALGQALDAATEALEREANAPPAQAASAVRRAGRLLGATIDRAGPAQKSALLAFAGRLDGACRARVAAECAADVLAPLAALTEARCDAALPGLERAARCLRDLEQEARRIGGGAAYDALFRDAAARIAALPAAHPMTPMDRARMIEILDGPEAALRALGG